MNFENDLGFSDTKTVPAFLADVRLGERWKIEFEYIGLSRDSSVAINRTLNWGDRSYAIGEVVSSEFDSDVYRLSGGYSFIKDSQKELGVTLGLHVTDFKLGLAATGIGDRNRRYACAVADDRGVWRVCFRLEVAALGTGGLFFA